MCISTFFAAAPADCQKQLTLLRLVSSDTTGLPQDVYKTTHSNLHIKGRINKHTKKTQQAKFSRDNKCLNPL